jgi:ParB-like chromosome segregation protein Spo0J
MSRKFDNATRVDNYRFDPLDICIVGGKGLPPDQQGPKDTELDPKHVLHVHDLLAPLKQEEIDDIYERGVMNAIEVIIIGGVPYVVTGRGRVRKARLANVRRKKAGLPKIEIQVSIIRETKGLELFRRIVAENLYRKEVSVLDRITMATELLNRGASKPEVAAMFGVSERRFDEWLTIPDKATPRVKEALEQNRINASGAIALANVAKTPEQMDKALADLLITANPSARAARKAAREATGKATDAKVTRHDLKALLEYIEQYQAHDIQSLAEVLQVILGKRENGKVHTLLEKARAAKKKKSAD